LPAVELGFPTQRKKPSELATGHCFTGAGQRSGAFPGGWETALYVRQGCLTLPASEFGIISKKNGGLATRSARVVLKATINSQSQT
jgi:hypothetical protein